MMKSLYQNGNHLTSFSFIDKPKLKRYKITILHKSKLKLRFNLKNLCFFYEFMVSN